MASDPASSNAITYLRVALPSGVSSGEGGSNARMVLERVHLASVVLDRTEIGPTQRTRRRENQWRAGKVGSRRIHVIHLCFGPVDEAFFVKDSRVGWNPRVAP